MEKNLQRRAVSLLLSRLGVLALGLLSFSGTAFAADPIKLGVTLGLSPPGSVSQATQIKDGLEVAAKIVNDAGGVLGRPIELVFENHQGTPEKGRAAVEKLIANDKAVAIIGEHQSSVALAGIEVAHRYRIPYINTNAAADAIRERGFVEVFNVADYNSRTAIVIADTLTGLKSRRIVAFAENTDYGVGLAKAIGERIKERDPQAQYKYEVLDRAAKDFLPAILPLRANPPDAVIQILIPPGAYILLNQLYEQGVAPSSKTWLFDASAVADFPDFWQNVKEAGKGLIVSAIYHPKMKFPPLGQKAAAAYTAKTGAAPGRLLFQAADTLFLTAEAIRRAGSTDPDALIKTLQNIKFEAARGIISFSQQKGSYAYQQWLEIPFTVFQITEIGQKVGDTTLVQEPGGKLDINKLKR